jgi:hypothetical protein
LILAGLAWLFVLGALAEGAEGASGGVVDAQNANDIAIYAEDNAMREVEQLVEREVEVILFGDSRAAGGEILSCVDGVYQAIEPVVRRQTVVAPLEDVLVMLACVAEGFGRDVNAIRQVHAPAL